MKNIVYTVLFLCGFSALSAQVKLEDPITDLPKGTVFVFEKDYIIPANTESITLGEGVIMHIHPSKKERRISSSRSFAVKESEQISRNKGGVAASLWMYIYFSDPNIKHLEVYLGDRNEKGFEEPVNQFISDLDASKLVKLSLPDIEEF